MTKKALSSPGRNSQDNLAEAVDRLTDMMSAVHDLMARFKDDMTWIINNRDEFGVVPSQAADISKSQAPQVSITPETSEALACFECDVEPPPSLAEALRTGWTGLIPHEGRLWEFLGLCPGCLEKSFTDPDAHEFAGDEREEEEPPVTKHHEGPRSLFEE